MSFSQFLSILRARWLSAVLVLLVTVGVTVGVSLVLPKQYTATANVLVDLRTPDPIVGMVLGGSVPASYMATQVDIIQSDRVARRVITALRLTENRQLREDWLDSTGGTGGSSPRSRRSDSMRRAPCSTSSGSKCSSGVRLNCVWRPTAPCRRFRRSVKAWAISSSASSPREWS